MRDILFRGKRADTGEWVEGSLVTMTGPINNGRKYILPTGQGLSFQHHGEEGESIGGFIEVDPKTVGQATHVIAKDGRHVFEGDILQYFDETMFIIWRGSGFYAMRGNGKPMAWVSVSGSEIIGNAYDNPEMLPGPPRA